MTPISRMRNPEDSTILNDITRWCVCLLALYFCYLLIADSARSGFARLLCTAAIVQSQVEPADRAVSVAPSDPETHYTRGLSLVNAERLDEALVELQLATRLRAHYYYEWLDLGVTRDRLGDTSGAELAIRESIRLAPTFAQPHWQLGNLLFRGNKFPEAFSELRQAAKSDPNLKQGLARLAWTASGGDVSNLISLVQPNSKKDHLMIALLLSGENRAPEAVEQVREGMPVTDEDEDRNPLRVTIMRLLAAKQFSSAREVWQLTHPAAARTSGDAQIVDGDFLEPIVHDDPGFGWQLGNIPKVSAVVDTNGPVAGNRSVRFDFNGEIPPVELISQLAVVQPESRYSLRFTAKAQSLVSAELPVVTVQGIDSDPVSNLAESPPVGVKEANWETYQLDFSTGKNSAIKLGLQRRPCNQTPCPIFGTIWLSHFSLVKL
jgi:hypothetical protein